MIGKGESATTHVDIAIAGHIKQPPGSRTPPGIAEVDPKTGQLTNIGSFDVPQPLVAGGMLAGASWGATSKSLGPSPWKHFVNTSKLGKFSDTVEFNCCPVAGRQQFSSILFPNLAAGVPELDGEEGGAQHINK